MIIIRFFRIFHEFKVLCDLKNSFERRLKGKKLLEKPFFFSVVFLSGSGAPCVALSIASLSLFYTPKGSSRNVRACLFGLFSPHDFLITSKNPLWTHPFHRLSFSLTTGLLLQVSPRT